MPVNPAAAKIDFAALTDRQTVQTTIYKQADLTLVRDFRVLDFIQGVNTLKFSWANTRIDPTSLQLEIKDNGGVVKIEEISYPPGTRQMGIWRINASKPCRVPVEITYFTSGISWESIYTIHLAKDQQHCRLSNYIRVTNQSGEDYSNAQTRLVLGKLNILDRISNLASRKFPYGKPRIDQKVFAKQTVYKDAARMLSKEALAAPAPSAPKEIKKEALSEYYLYTIEGRETIPDGWSKQMISLSSDTVKVKTVYRYEKEKFRNNVVRFLVFANDTANNLGQTPLPGGTVNVFASGKKKGELNFIGTDRTKYIPVGKKVELKLGNTRRIEVNPKIMNYQKSNLLFDNKGNLTGFDEIRDYVVDVSNFTKTDASVEYTLNLEHPHFKIKRTSKNDGFEKIDQDTIRFTVSAAPGKTHQITFTIISMRGQRQWQ